jgi:hypothetical protein
MLPLLVVLLCRAAVVALMLPGLKSKLSRGCVSQSLVLVGVPLLSLQTHLFGSCHLMPTSVTFSPMRLENLIPLNNNVLGSLVSD